MLERKPRKKPLRDRTGVRPETERASIFTRRALLVLGAQTAVTGVLAAKLYETQVMQNAKYALLADSNRISTRLMLPPRGRILDRGGEILAGNRLNWRALLMAEETDEVARTLDNFSRVVTLPDHERARVERELHRHRKFIPVMLTEFLSWEDMARIEVNAPDLPGVIVDVGTTRVYPLSEKFAHIAGYVAPPSEADMGDDPVLALPGVRVGRMGVEKSQEDALQGTAGAVQSEVNANGRVIRELNTEEGEPGQDVGITIDSELQRVVNDRLKEESASAVVMDCRNGEVLALVTNPSFNPELFNSGVSQAQWVEWTNNRRSPLINKAVAGLYAPGSTFKMAVALAAMEAGTLHPGDRINCPGFLDVGDTRFHCWSKNGHGSLDIHNGIKHSCDVFFYETARRVGTDRIALMSHRLGLGTELDIDLPGQRAGLIPTRAWRMKHGHPWTLGDGINVGIGQGYVQVTPLQLATYASRIATGRAVQPHLTRTIGGVVQTGAKAEDWPSLGINEASLHAVRAGMFGVVNEAGGTAPLARIPGITVAGKTGSSQVRHVSRAERESGHFRSDKLPWEFRPHALFVAYAPYDAPRYAMAVVVEHGNAGAQAAAPLARAILEDTFSRDPVNRDYGARLVSERS